MAPQTQSQTTWTEVQPPSSGQTTTWTEVPDSTKITSAQAPPQSGSTGDAQGLGMAFVSPAPGIGVPPMPQEAVEDIASATRKAIQFSQKGIVPASAMPFYLSPTASKAGVDYLKQSGHPTAAKVAGAYSGFTQGGSEALSGLTSPTNIGIMVATGGLGSLPGAAGKIIPRLVSAGFSYQMLSGAYKTIPAIKQSIDNDNYEDTFRLVTQAGINTGMGLAAGAHAGMGEEAPQATPRANETPVEVAPTPKGEGTSAVNLVDQPPRTNPSQDIQNHSAEIDRMQSILDNPLASPEDRAYAQQALQSSIEQRASLQQQGPIKGGANIPPRSGDAAPNVPEASEVLREGIGSHPYPDSAGDGTPLEPQPSTQERIETYKNVLNNSVMLDKINSPEDVKTALGYIAETLGGRIDPRITQPLTAAMRQQLASELGMTENELMDTPVGKASSPEQMEAARTLFESSRDSVLQSFKDAQKDPSKIDDAYTKLARHAIISEAFTGMKQEAGRTLQAIGSSEDSELETLAKGYRDMSPEEKQEAAKRISQLDRNHLSSKSQIIQDAYQAVFDAKGLVEKTEATNKLNDLLRAREQERLGKITTDRPEDLIKERNSKMKAILQAINKAPEKEQSIRMDKLLSGKRDLNTPDGLDKALEDAKRPLPNFWDKLFEFNVNMLLSNGAIPLKAIGDTAMELQAKVTKPIAGAIDAVRSGISNTPRERYAGEVSTPRLGKTVPSSIKMGFEKAGRTFGDSYRGEGPDFEGREPAITSKWMRWSRLPGAAISALTKGEETYNYQSQLRAIALRAIKNNGLDIRSSDSMVRGASEHRYLELLKNPPLEMQIEAMNYAKQQVFLEDFDGKGAFNSLMRDVAMRLQNNQYTRFLFPFVRVSANFARESFRTSPLGFIGTLKGMGLDGLKGGELSDALAKNVLGTAIFAWAYNRATTKDSDGNSIITGGGDFKSPKAKVAAIAEGWQPYSIKIGDSYYSYKKIPFLYATLGLAAVLAEAKDNKKQDPDFLSRVETALKKTGTLAAEDISFMSSLSQINDLIDGHKTVSQWLIDKLPFGGVRSITHLIDPVVRKPTTTGERIESNIPGLSQNVPPKMGPDGQPVKRDWRNLGGFNPINVSRESNDPTVRAISDNAQKPKLPNKFERAGNAPETPAEKLELDAQDKQMLYLQVHTHPEWISSPKSQQLIARATANIGKSRQARLLKLRQPQATTWTEVSAR